MTDTRVVYGARCLWWDSIDKCGRVPGSGLPGCPHCGSVLYEVPSDAEWWNGARKYEASGNPGYVAMLKWSRGKCYPTLDALRAAYAEDTGR